MTTLKYKTQNGYRPLPAMVVRKTNAENGNGIGTCSTSSGTALTVSLTGYELVTNGFIAVTFANDVPASATLNINGKGAKPIYYKGSAIEADVIKADDTVTFCYDGTNYVVTSLGGGGQSFIMPTFVNIHLESTRSSIDARLIGATIIVTDTTKQEIILSTTWQNEDISLSVDTGISYTITVGNVEDYVTPSAKSYTSTGGFKNVNFMYVADVVDLGLPSGLQWCAKNIGANTIGGRGLYFAWGKTVGYEYESGHDFSNESTGPTGNLSYSQDAVYAQTNGACRLPTKAEFEELIAYTDMEQAVIDGLSGIKFMKKTNHNIYIFLPGAGYYFTTTYGGDGSLNYWSSTYERGTLVCEPNSLNVRTGNANSSNGITVRGVKI